MAGKWTILDREYHNDKWDLLTCQIDYFGKRPRSIVNQYLVLKHEKRVPYAEMKDRKWGNSRTLDKKKWQEGTVKGRRRR